MTSLEKLFAFGLTRGISPISSANTRLSKSVAHSVVLALQQQPVRHSLYSIFQQRSGMSKL